MAKKKTSKAAAKKTAKRTSGSASKKAPAKKAPTKKTSSRKAPAGKPRAGKPKDADLAGLRTRIDAVDAKLIELLNERASLVVEVGKTKRAGDIPIYAPHREAQVLDRVLAANAGPLPGRTIEGIYKELMSGSFALEQPLRIGYLGPQGSNSHVAAVRQFGSSVEYEDLREIAGVFTEVRRGHVNYGLVPIENTTGGGIAETLGAFLDNARHLNVYAEVQIAIHHALLSNCKPNRITRIHSKPEVFSQCRNWLATQFPNAEQIAAPSSSRAAQIAAEEHATALRIGSEPNSAAIGTALAGQLYGLKTVFPRIEDNPDNITRFFVISRQQAKRSGDDKTSIMFNTADKPGALVEVLKVFDAAGINLSHIDKRPSGRENWQYTFFIDAQGHRDDANMAQAILESERHCQELVVLGSYPRAKRIL